MVKMVKLSGDYEAVLYSAGGTVQAADEIRRGKIDNAFKFTSFGDHHADRDLYGGMCYFNGTALTITLIMEKGVGRFAIVDTDCHHADSTMDIFGSNEDVLHVYFCYEAYSDCSQNVDVRDPYYTSDEDYLATVRQEFIPEAVVFQSKYVF
jgi:acetoin utilization deacetylase AcuC-like enzyme